MVMKSLSQSYNRENVLYDLSNFLTESFNSEDKHLNLRDAQYENIDEAHYLGKNNLFSVFEIFHNRPTDARITLTKMAVHIMKDRGLSCALFFFVPKDKETFRISLVTVDWANNRQASNPRRFSFLVGKGQKLHTANKQLSTPAVDKADLIKKFSIEVVNDAFYDSISKHFYQLIQEIKHPTATANTEEGFKTLQNFCVRLIGRLIFCWFLKKKYRTDGTPLIPEDLLSTQAVKDCKDSNYYHEILEPLFFETLNKEVQNRIPKCKQGAYAKIPFLNGGLFSPKDDFYKLEQFGQSAYYNNLIIKNSWFESLFEVLETYNFTIDENTSSDIDLAVDPEMLGRIFENLLAAINPETQESVRKATGSYYTPREIVDYMVNQSLKQYLYTKTDIDHKKIDSLFEFDSATFTEQETKNIYNALLNLKIIDPAVGSGAFPMGILQKIIGILNIIDPKGTICNEGESGLTKKEIDYKHKAKLIKDCIYGIDIQTVAIEICRLRFFLTLIVDEHNEHIQPLPNLEFTFVCANSLIPLPKTDSNFLFGNEELINKLKNIREEYFKSYGQNKKDLQKQFENTQLELFHQRIHGPKQYLINDPRYQVSTKQETLNDMTDMLSTWKPFNNESNSWFDPFWMFGVENGFDIVIGNPPYVKVENLDIETRDNLRKYFGFLNDLYVHFIFKGYALLKDKGLLSYITNDGFLGFNNTMNIRELFFKNDLIAIIKCPYETFNASIYTAIFFLSKRTSISKTYNTCEFIALENERAFYFKNHGKIPYQLSNLLVHNRIVIYSPLVSIISKFITMKQLKHICQVLDTGIHSGNCRNKILSLVETENCKNKVLQGKQIDKYILNWNSPRAKFKWCNINYQPKNEFGIGRGGKVSAKKEYWHFCGEADNHLATEKLLMRQTEDDLVVCYVNKNKDGLFYTDNTLFTILPHKSTNIKLLIGLLNSNLLNCVYHFISQEQGRSMAQVKTQVVDSLPIPDLSFNISLQKEIINKVDKILAITQTDDYLDNIDKQKKVTQYQDEIDQMVYKLYGLTEEEIKIVEESQSNKE